MLRYDLILSAVLVAAVLPGQEPPPAGGKTTPLGEPPRSPPSAERLSDKGAPQNSSAARVVAIGDVHGDAKTVVKLLADLKITDADGHWAAGTRHVVQTGDLVDRGPHSLETIALFMRLQAEAKAAGGRVVVLLGNHEIWNLLGDLYYVSPEEFRELAAKEPRDFRVRTRDRILKLIRKPHVRLRSPYYRRLAGVLNERNFSALFPPGSFEYQRAVSPLGSAGTPASRYGKWLLNLPLVHREAGVLFVHGGLSARYAKSSVESLNKGARDELQRYFQTVEELEKAGVYDRYLGWAILQNLAEAELRAGGADARLVPLFNTVLRLRDGILYGAESPTMYRGLALARERTLRRLVDATLRRHDVSRIVIGHTQPKSLRIEGRFDDRVWLIDTGMNQSAYGGRPSALAVYEGGKVRVWE